jgi:ATP-dependent RNA helicase DDX23/PRP28
MLRKKKQEEESKSKVRQPLFIRGHNTLLTCVQPKFLMKEERERIALEKRAKEVEARRAQEKAKGNADRDFVRASAPNGPSTDRRGKDYIPTGPRSAGPRNGQTRPHYEDRQRNNSRSDAKRYPSQRDSTFTRRRGGSPIEATDDKKRSTDTINTISAEDSELASMRARYMGVAPPKTKKRRLNDRKFVFDWSVDADTSTNSTAERAVNVGFGRGHFGGFDHPSNARGGLDRHWSEKKLVEMTERDWRIFREDYSISTKGIHQSDYANPLGGSIPAPLRNWEEAELPASLLKVIRDVKYTEPTPIQRQSIPIGLKCRDLIGIAETGSGKTAAFVIPILVYIKSLPPINDASRNDGPYAIVLAPTRELAQQIEMEAQRFAKPMGFNVVSIVGGHAIEEQVHNLRNGAEIVIATPGRLVDCLEKHVLVLSQCNYIVMDEADRMIDLGFEEDVQRVLDALPLSNIKPDTDEAENPELMSRMLRLGRKDLRYRQTVMFSATMPPPLERLAKKYLRRPATIIIGNAGQAVDTVEQRVVMISSDDEKRRKKLEEILSHQEGPIIVFVREKRICDALARDLSRQGVRNPHSLF